MSNGISITIPAARELKRESGWKQVGGAKHSYYAIRCHYAIRERQLDEPVKRGEVVDAYTSARGLVQKKSQMVEFEHTSLRIEEAIRQSLLEEESILEFTSTLAGGLGVDVIGKISGELQAKAQARLAETFSQSFKVQTSNTLRQKTTISWEYTVDPEKFSEGATVVLTKAYKRYSYDFYLALVDYLTVKYVKPSPFSKLRRVKYPPIIAGRAFNFEKLNLPLASIQFWKLLPHAFLPIDEKNYKLEVEDPFDIKVAPLVDERPLHAQTSLKPTLYRLSNSAFPLKR